MNKERIVPVCGRGWQDSRNNITTMSVTVCGGGGEGANTFSGTHIFDEGK